MTEHTEQSVVYEIQRDHVAVVRLNRPDAQNAINGDVAERIERCVEQSEADGRIRAVVLAANGRNFCAGADLKEVAAGRGLSLARPVSGFAGIVYARRSKPWIAAIQGAALGGGCEIALACDMVVAGESARIGLPEVKRGIIAGAAGAFRIGRALPRAIAIEMLTTGAPILARRAFDLGLVNRVIPDDAILEEALKLARQIAANSPLAVRESLAIARSSVDVGEDALRTALGEAQDRVFAGPDATEGPRAFVEKREPEWSA